MPVPLVDRLRGRPTEAEQQTEQTKQFFGEIVKLAPQMGHSWYVSSSLAGKLFSSLQLEDSAKITAGALNLHESDLLHISWGSSMGVGYDTGLAIHNNSDGNSTFGARFDPKTFRMKGVVIENKPFANADQALLNSLMKLIKDDLKTRRTQWKESMEEQRRGFVERLSPQETLVLTYVMGALDTDDDYSVFGVIEDKDEGDNNSKTDNNQTRRIRLFFTHPVTEEVADNIFREVDGNSVIDSYYVKNLMQSHINDSIIDSRMLVVRYPDFQVQVENFWPATNKDGHIILADNEWITEGLFEAFLRGHEQAFRPLTSAQNPILLEQLVDQDFFDTRIDAVPSEPKSPATV